jgi:hypothetical protein
MAGNTKLIGFGANGVVELERWGGKTKAVVSKESLETLRSACYQQLPKSPTQKPGEGRDDFNVAYNSSVGRIGVDLDTVTAGELASFLQFALEEFQGCDDGTGEALGGIRKLNERVPTWISDLKDAVQAHEDYLNTDDEPGVDSNEDQQ